jgi:DNA-binding protein Fis
MDDQMKRVITEKLPKVSEVNQTDIAEMIGISVDTLRNYKKLTELIPKFVVSYEY